MHQDRSRNDARLTVVYALMLGVLAVGYRLVAPYKLLGPNADFAWNLVPVGALALFVGARLPSLWAWLIPLGAMVVSDLLLIPAYGADSIAWTSTPFTYASFLLYATLGRVAKPSIDSPLRLLGTALAGGGQFFLVTNFAAWAFIVIDGVRLYPKTFAGLIQCYEMAIPFQRGSFVGDLFFTPLFFAGYAAFSFATRPTPAQEAV